MKELRELVELFTSHGLTDFELENEDIRVRLSKNTGQIPHASSASIAPSSAPVSSSGQASPSSTASSGSESASSSTTSSATSTAAGDASRAGAEDLHIISAPIVGTFYRKPSPTSEPFVSVGSRVEAASVVCIIEAMKLMNEILAETTGVVEKIYVEDGQPVEYGQPLFGIRK
jgi:acetyl-CoA carboxylase biotin carboxyl carrier protein